MTTIACPKCAYEFDSDLILTMVNEELIRMTRIPTDRATLLAEIDRVLQTFPGNHGYGVLRMAREWIAAPASDRELAQAYAQGYQDGRRGLVAALREAISDREAKRGPTDVKARKWREVVGPSEGEVAQRAALAKVAQPQPATKRE